MTIWSPEREAALRAFVQEGLTGTQIAQRMGAGFTRNMCISKAFRMELRLCSGKVGGRPTPRNKRSRPPRPVRALMVLGPSKTLLELGPSDCLFPVGEIETGMMDRMPYCGLPRKPGSSYCPAHHRIAYVERRREAVQSIGADHAA